MSGAQSGADGRAVGIGRRRDSTLDDRVVSENLPALRLNEIALEVEDGRISVDPVHLKAVLSFAPYVESLWTFELDRPDWTKVMRFWCCERPTPQAIGSAAIEDARTVENDVDVRGSLSRIVVGVGDHGANRLRAGIDLRLILEPAGVIAGRPLVDVRVAKRQRAAD